jgi:hypothetical protein
VAEVVMCSLKQSVAFGYRAESHSGLSRRLVCGRDQDLLRARKRAYALVGILGDFTPQVGEVVRDEMGRGEAEVQKTARQVRFRAMNQFYERR